MSDAPKTAKVYGAGIKCSVCGAEPWPDDPAKTRESFDLLKIDGVWLCERCRPPEEKRVAAAEAAA
jgi:hypothetical protein